MNPDRWWVWRLRLELAVWRYGWGGAASLMLSLMAGIFWVWMVASSGSPEGGGADNYGSMGVDNRATDASAADLVAARVPIGQTLATLPPLEEAHRTVDALVDSARRRGVQVDRLEVQYQPETPAGLVRADYSVPLRGGYVMVRQSLEDAMREQSHLAIDRLSFRREGPGTPLLAQVHLSGWYRSGGLDTRPVTVNTQPRGSR